MVSTYSPDLKIQLMATGEKAGDWGNITNVNLGTLLEEAIVGYDTLSLTGLTTATLLITDGVSSKGRNYVIQFTGSPSTAVTVTVPTVDKPYIFFNSTGQAVTVKVSGGTGVAIAAGKKAIVYTNSSDVIEVVNAPVSEAGTQTLSNKTLSAPILGTPASGTLTNCTGLPVGTGISGLGADVNTALGLAATGTAGGMVRSTGATLVTPNLGTPTSLTLTSATGLPLTTGVTGTLPILNGGTGVTTFGTGVQSALGQNVTGSGGAVLNSAPTITNPTVTNYVESVVAIGTVTTTNTISLTAGTVQTATLTASTACTFTMPTATAGKSFVLLLKQAASTGNGTATFTGVKWGSGGAPTITATAGRLDILTFVADGTNWYGSYSQGYTP